MGKCTTKTLYESIEACPGRKTRGGLRRRLYCIPKSSIATWPELGTSVLPKGAQPEQASAGMAALAVYTGDFTLAADQYFFFIDLKPDASNATFETVGEEGSKLFNNKANAVIVGQPDSVKGFVCQAVNDDLVYVYQQNDGKFAVIGCEAFNTKTVASGDTGQDVTGASTTTLELSCYDDCCVPTYTGKLYLSATDYIDCATGELTKGG